MSNEPECTCEGNGPYTYARGCEYHDPDSEWNRAFRADPCDTEYERDMEMDMEDAA